MKKIEKPFAESAISRLEKAETAYCLAHKRYSDLKFLRDKLVAGKLTPELYDFINADGSLESLFPCLPRPTEVACEALSASQLEILDATIAEEALNLKELLKTIWEAIKDWWMDWWDRNRFEKRNLDVLLGYWHNSPGSFGDDTTFAASQVLMYSHQNWYDMLKACQELNNICKTIANTPVNQLTSATEKARISCSVPLTKFGKYVDENGIIRIGQPNFIRRENSCANLRWRYVEIGDYLSNAKMIMEDDIEIRKQFSALEKLFLSGNPTDKSSYMFAKRLIFSSKECNLHIGRTLRVMLNKIMRDRAAMYRMTNR